MKLRNLFYLLLALPLVFAACEKGSDDADKTPEVKEPVLTLTSKATVDVTATGGEFEITYTLENKKDGVELTATCDADWVDVTVGDKVKVVVEANEGDAREAKVVVAYETQKFEVTYKQVEKGEVVAPVLTLTSEATLEFEAEGGNGEITYTLENPAEGVELEATCEADWVTNLTVGEKVTFTVAANEGEARETKVVVAYDEQSFEVAVKQAKKADEPVVPGEPTAFTPVKVTANLYETGNFILNLFVTDTTRHEFDMYDTVSPNSNYLSDGTYSSENETIGLGDSYFYNGTKSVAMASAELTLKLNDDWTVTITGEFASEEGQAHTINWTGVVDGFTYPNQPMVKTYNIVSFEASTRAADVWDIIMSEQDRSLGEVFSRITIQLPEDNAMYITDGTYSVENGGILVNTSTQNGYSTWRYGSADPVDIQICEVKVANNLEAETSVIEGSIQIGLDTYVFKYEGKVQGFRYKVAGADGITDWEYGYIYSQWSSNKCSRLEFKSVYGDEITLFVTNNSDPIANGLGEGTYVVDNWQSTKALFIEADSSKVNGNGIVSGEMVVEMVDTEYKITINFVDSIGGTTKGVYQGSLSK